MSSVGTWDLSFDKSKLQVRIVTTRLGITAKITLLRFRPRFAQKVRTGVTSFTGTGYLSWFNSLSVSSLGLKEQSRDATVAVRYNNPRGPVGPWAVTISPC